MAQDPAPHPTQEPRWPAGATALIVDDHPLFCDALAMTLRAVAGFAAVEATHRMGTAIERLGHPPMPDLIVLDLNLPDVDGLDGLLRLRAAAGAVPVLVVSSMADSRMIAATIAAGAAGFVPKHAGRDTFRAALATLAAGGRYLPESYLPADPATGSRQDDAIARLALLTPQQGRILEMICQGMLNKQIAYDLSIAETTVKAHVTAIMRKLGVQSRTQAVLIAQAARFATLMPEA